MKEQIINYLRERGLEPTERDITVFKEIFDRESQSRIAQLEKQISMDTVRFKEMEESGLKLEQQNTQLLEREQEQVIMAKGLAGQELAGIFYDGSYRNGRAVKICEEYTQNQIKLLNNTSDDIPQAPSKADVIREAVEAYKQEHSTVPMIKFSETYEALDWLIEYAGDDE